MVEKEKKKPNQDLFEDLFVLEMANNHWGSLSRGRKIVRAYEKVVRKCGVRAALKLQFRDVEHFIHKAFTERDEIRYVKKTLDTRMIKSDIGKLVQSVREAGFITIATPFDEASVDFACELGIEIIKVASSDLGDWPLIEKIASTKKPVVVSTGGSNLKEIDAFVEFFEKKRIPLAINHCVSLYPSEDGQLELNQIDFLRERYPKHTIGFSTHEQNSWDASMYIAYAKGARTFERHIDIEADGIPVSPYCSLPEQVETWFRAYLKAKQMCGNRGTKRRIPSEEEMRYLQALLRGVYAKRDLPAGHRLNRDDLETDFYLAIPLQAEQLSCREVFQDGVLREAVSRDEPVKKRNVKR